MTKPDTTAQDTLRQRIAERQRVRDLALREAENYARTHEPAKTAKTAKTEE